MYACAVQVGAISKEQVRKFIMNSLRQGIFTEFFSRQEAEVQAAVDQLFTRHFEEIFATSSRPGEIEKATLQKLVEQKFADDQDLLDVLLSELEKMESPENSLITEQVVKDILVNLMKKHMKQLMRQREDDEQMRDWITQNTEGEYAKEMITRVIASYKESGLVSGDPFTDIKDLMDLFFNDERVNSFNTMVCGNDFCDMLGLFFDLAEAMQILQKQKVEEMEKYKIAYNNRVRRDKRRQEEEEKKKEEDDDEKFAVIRKANTQLTVQNQTLTEQLKEMQEHVDLLIDENDEKDKYVRQLELDLKDRNLHSEQMAQGAKLAT